MLVVLAYIVQVLPTIAANLKRKENNMAMLFNLPNPTQQQKNNRIMTQEDKELLIRDLCSRLPYGVMIEAYKCFADKIVFIDVGDKNIHVNYEYSIEDVKPYLFPLSSITKEQESELIKQGLVINFKGLEDISSSVIDMTKWIDWLNAHHFDYRGLIDKGLAIDATNLNIY